MEPLHALVWWSSADSEDEEMGNYYYIKDIRLLSRGEVPDATEVSLICDLLFDRFCPECVPEEDTLYFLSTPAPGGTESYQTLLQEVRTEYPRSRVEDMRIEITPVECIYFEYQP
jgi:hypothetical protein